ncbi:zinc-dependent metalloprotease [Sinomicrobium weinanense]|uniref:Zinc-dependent metalloprotease n=1 Tax=Sinomicrobium weinanense TaxID=2842200 RepID=A0A926JQN7_9FLAO|nr:zinc-dependent metalloprotease [Sinomicrobium weinanense]MBC9795673.1 zinc-dependent metalloprotease [Sinomicrobium weinanense]MBU3122842.1 zinc-dependent metalloprotease [Sinomicrobium weinanense]
MKKTIFLILLCFAEMVQGQFLDKKKDLEKFNGYFDFYYDDAEGKIYLEVENPGTEFLYVYSLSQGVGSNDIGLDRGQLGNEQIVYFKKEGNKLLLIQPNMKYRAITDNVKERRSVEQAFAKSVLFGFEIKEKRNGAYIIDVTDFLLRDAHGVAHRLKEKKQGTYKLDKNRSALSMERTKAFPKNTEFEALITFEGDPKGKEIRSVTPDARLVSVMQHHSFIELPDDGYVPRDFTPGSGMFSVSYYDYASPVYEPIIKRYIARHRLEKKDPAAKVSEAKTPIIYYLDPGTPEPVRSALLEGGRWWNQAFESIGYKNAFRLKMLPDGADPMDVRYNVVQWVHRSTRGWSYGASVRDPRTGEIIKGHVSLGSLRVRQDFLIAQALINKPFAERDDNYQAMLDMALARIRQLSAHEIGHTLGFAHNFAASISNRASVMDYPHPVVKLKNREIDISEAYATGIGAWDKVTVAYAYSDFGKGANEAEELHNILKEAQSRGLRFISDADARAQGGAHAYAHLWDNGEDAVTELNRVLEVRDVALRNFSEDNIRGREPYSVLEDVFVPLYFFHRYQTEAAVKLIGGLDYNYAVKGDGQFITKAVDKEEQTNALRSVLRTVSAETLAIPEDKLNLFPPRALGYPRTRESFTGKTGVAFDALSAAETAADFTLRLLLHPEKASRLVQQKALDNAQPGLSEVLDELIAATLKKNYKDSYRQEVQHIVNFRVLYYLMNLAKDQKGYPQVNAIAKEKLREMAQELSPMVIKGDRKTYALEYLDRIKRFMEKPETFKTLSVPKIPDGSPIGMDCAD